MSNTDKKTVNEILLETHADRDYNHRDILKAFGVFAKQLKTKYHALIFKGQQRVIWPLLSNIPMSTGEISHITGIPSKNATKQLSAMTKTGLVQFNRNGKLKYWYTLDK